MSRLVLVGSLTLLALAGSGCGGSSTSGSPSLPPSAQTSSAPATGHATTTSTTAAEPTAKQQLNAYLVSFQKVRVPLKKSASKATAALTGISTTSTDDWPSRAQRLQVATRGLDHAAQGIAELDAPSGLHTANQSYVTAVQGLEAELESMQSSLAQKDVAGAESASAAMTTGENRLIASLLKWKLAVQVAAHKDGYTLPGWVAKVG